MRIAVDSKRFRRRIKETEQLLADNFSDSHRGKMVGYMGKGENIVVILKNPMQWVLYQSADRYAI